MTRLSLLLLSTAAITLCQPPPMQQGDGVWSRNAYFGEAQTFDSCVGHQPGNGQYHHHASPTCLRAQLNDNLVLVSSTRNGPVYREKAAPWTHSPILGWSYDGYPIYGPYGYSDPNNPNSPIRRMRTSFRLRNITARTTLADWSLAYLNLTSRDLPTNRQGPPINATFPLGRYVEDFEFVDGLGDLDVHNGRRTITPEFPNGTYAYFITIDETGTPAFPYILGRQYYGTLNGGNAANVPAAAGEPSSSAPAIPQLQSWLTRNNQQNATAKSAFDPSAQPSETWPFETVAGARTSGGVRTPTKADVQRIRFTDTDVYVNSNNLASYTMGPWYDALMGGGVFSNWPSAQNTQARVTRNPAPAATKTNTGLGAVGIFVNGVAVFNMLDGGTYSTTASADAGGGLVSPTAVHVSAASYEKGPLAKGALASAFSMFGAALATSTETAASATWPTSLAGTTVLIRDSAGVSHNAPIYYVSPTQVNYRIPDNVAVGFAVVTITANGVSYPGNIHVRDVYPNLFQAGYVTRAGATAIEPVDQPIAVNIPAYLTLFATGLGNTTDVKATIGGVDAEVLFAGPQGAFAGLDQINVAIPQSLAGKGRVEVILTAAGKTANSMFLTIR